MQYAAVVGSWVDVLECILEIERSFMKRMFAHLIGLEKSKNKNRRGELDMVVRIHNQCSHIWIAVWKEGALGCKPYQHIFIGAPSQLMSIYAQISRKLNSITAST